MDCLDRSVSLNALVAISLIIAGSNLMINKGVVVANFGAFCFALGYFILALAASNTSLDRLRLSDRRYVLALGSAVAIVAGTFLMYYHIQTRLRELLAKRLAGYPVVREDIVKSIPVLHHVLIYGGLMGLVLAISLRRNGSLNLVKGGLALAAVVVIGYTKQQMLEALVADKDATRHQVAHLLSYLLLVLAVAYKC